MPSTVTDLTTTSPATPDLVARTAVDPALSDLGARLLAHVHDTTLALDDDLLGLPLSASLFATPAVTVRDVIIDASATDSVTAHGLVDVFDAVDVMFDLRVSVTDDGLEAEVNLGFPATAGWGPVGLGLSGVEVQVAVHGSGADRRVDGMVTGTTTHGPVTLSVVVPVGGAGAWAVAFGLSGDTLALLADLAGDLLTGLVGDGAPVAALHQLDHVEVGVVYDPHAHRLDHLSIDLDVAEWQVSSSFAVSELRVQAAVDHPMDATRRQVLLAIDATCTAGEAALPVRLERVSDGTWQIRLSGGDGDGLALQDVVAAFGGGDVFASLPAEVTGMPQVRLADVALVIDPAAPSASRAITSLSLLVEADWDVIPGRLSLRQAYAGVEARYPADAATRKIGIRLGGTVDIGDLAFTLAAERPVGDPGAAPWVFTGGLVPGSPATLEALVRSLTGIDAGLPPEVPDLAFTELSFASTPQTGAFVLDGVCELGWSLPFGGSGLAVGHSALHVERGPAPATTPVGHGPVQATLQLDAAAPLAVAEGFDVTSFALRFGYDGAAGSWSLAGTVDVELFDHAASLGASVSETATERRFTFEADGAAAPAVVDLAGAGSLTARKLAVDVTRSLAATGTTSPGAALPRAGTRIDATSTYAWSVEADGRLDLLDGTIAVDGTVTLDAEPDRVRLALLPAPDAGELVHVPLPAAPSIGLHLGVDRLRFTRTTVAEATTWTVDAAAAFWCSGLPHDLAALVPSSPASELRGTLQLATGTEASVTFGVSPVLPVATIVLPPLEVGDTHIDLSDAPLAIEIGRVEVRWSRSEGVTVGAELGFGLPPALNRLLGAHADVFTTWDPDKPETMVRARLAATTAGAGGPSLELAPLTSAFKKLVLEPVVNGRPERQATLDLGPCGRLTLVVPTIGYQGQTFRARGSFQQHDLALPTSPLVWLAESLGIKGVDRFLPDRIPLDQPSLLDADGHLDLDRLLDAVWRPLTEVPGLQLPPEAAVEQALQVLVDRLDRLPDRLLPYLSPRLPESFSFDVAVTATGGMLGSIGVAPPGAVATRAAEPVRLLLPGLSVTGPVLNGVELWNLSIGELFGGAALLVKADLNIDQFDLVPLATLMSLPDDVVAELPIPPQQVTRRLVAERVVLVVVPEAFVAVPLFFDDLAVEYRGVEGIELGTHLRLPQPQLDLQGALQAFGKLREFFTSPDAQLDEHLAASAGLDLQLTAGPCFLDLPAYLGGQVLGSRTDTTTISAFSNLAHLLNGMKGLRLDELFRSLPAELLHAPPAPQPHVALGPLTFDAAWDVGTPAGAERGLAVHVEGTGALGPIVGVVTQLDLTSRGTTAFDGAIQVDGALGGFLGVHLDGTLDVGGGPARADGAAALTFDDPSARAVAPGPAWAPHAFTIEWWLYPTTLADYNQTVSGSEVWGSFVFHTTANGAVYAGTDVLSRFTPADIPPGTVELNRWQHFAFTFADGFATLLKDGVVLAMKANLDVPRPWTGLHLGTSSAGSQLQGSITEVRIWDHARPPAVIHDGMARRVAGTEPGLVAAWSMTEGAGSLLHDLGPSGWHATAVATGWRVSTSGPPALPTLVSAAPSPAASSPAATSPFRLTGNGALSLFGRTVMSGHAQVGTDGVALDGHLDLFPGNPTLRVTGNVAGAVDAEHVDLHGNAAVAVAGFTLSSAVLDVTERHVAISGQWLGFLDTNLSIDASSGGLVLSGSISGGIDVNAIFGSIFVADGTAKLADSFPISSLASLELSVTISERQGFWAAGEVQFPLNGQPQHLPLFVHARNMPSSRQELQQVIAKNLLLMDPLPLFKTAYQDASAWVTGAVHGSFGWTRGAYRDTSKALRLGYAQSAAGIAQVLDAASYTAAEIGTVLRTEFIADAATMVQTLAPLGFGVKKVADAVYGAFEQALHRDSYTAARSVITMIRNWYGAIDMATVARDSFGLGAEPALGLLKEQRYIARELGAAAKDAYHLGVEDAGRIFSQIDVTAEDALKGLAAAYSYDERQVATALSGVGYATSALNSVLDKLHLPRI